VSSPHRGVLDALIAEATVDCYDDSECVTGFSTMIASIWQCRFRPVCWGSMSLSLTSSWLGMTGSWRSVLGVGGASASGSWICRCRCLRGGGGVDRGVPSLAEVWVRTVSDVEHWVRLTEQEAQLNVRTVLELCAAGEVRCSEKTSRPSAASVRIVGSHLAHGDFYRERFDRCLRLAGRCWSRPVGSPRLRAGGCT
jgi:hypothetical protein